MKSLFLLVAVLGLLVFAYEKGVHPVKAQLAEMNSSLAQADVLHDDFEVPVDETVFSPCAGEFIHFTGAYHVEVHTVVDANGGFHSHFTANDRNISGVGLSSGTKYRRVGVTHDSFNASGPPPLEETFTNSFNFIGQGASNNTLLFETFHITVNANGTVTAFVDNSRLECR